MREKIKQSAPHNNNEERISLSNLDGFTSHYQEMNIFNHLKQRNTRHNLLHPVLSSCNPKSMKMLLLSGDKELYHAPKHNILHEETTQIHKERVIEFLFAKMLLYYQK